MQQSAAILVDQKVRELRAAGRSVIGLGSGEPDFDTPENIKEAARRAIAAGKTKYTTVDGIAELKAVIVDKLQRINRLAYAPNEISVGAGGKQVIANALAASLEPGDEVIIAAPYWVSYPDMAKLWGGVPTIVECPQSSGFKLTAGDLAAAITPRTKWLILNSPSNPSGACYTRGELEELAAVLRSHDRVNVMSDDIYEAIMFDGEEFVTLLNVAPELRDRTVIVNGVSKSYCMTGWRLGYAAGPRALIAEMAKIQGQSTTHPSSISQWAAVEALSGDQTILATMVATYQRRRDRIVAALNKAPGIDCALPKGAFYVYPSCAGAIGKRAPNGRIIESDTDFALNLLDCAGVAVVQGAAFGLSPHFRISIAAADEVLEKAAALIREFCERLS
jgi:aspartate aminotransferase